MRRIRTSGGYHHGRDCELFDELTKSCEHHYCNRHRLLWSDCDTAKKGLEGDQDVVNGTRAIWELGDCPDCELESEQTRINRLIADEVRRKSHLCSHGFSRARGTPFDCQQCAHQESLAIDRATDAVLEDWMIEKHEN